MLGARSPFKACFGKQVLYKVLEYALERVHLQTMDMLNMAFTCRGYAQKIP